MKKFLIVALAALGFVACNDNHLDDVNNGGFTGEVETSYIAINLNAAENGTRADDGAYQDGLAAERAVKSAYFFFFDAEGKAFPVTGNPATEPGGTVNWISANLNNIGSATPNVSDIKDAVLVLSTYKGTYPAQIVAVLNWPPVTGKAYDLDDLYDATNIQGVDSGFVMSNAVYSDGTKAVVGTPLTESDIYTSPADALANPITIHVERIAAKVTVTANGVADNRFKVTKTATINGKDTEVFVQVTGWELHNDFTQSKLLKYINLDWKDANLGFTWNDSPYYRCYWAESLAMSEIVGNVFPETFGLELGNAEDVDDDGVYADNTYTYIGENTNYVVNNTDACTKVIIKAKLQKKTSETVYEDLPMTRWYTTYYADLDDLLTAVANTIKYQYYWYDKDSTKYNYITPDDLTVVKEGNWVKFALSTPSEGKSWFVNAAGGYEAKTHAEINASLAAIEKALYYESGDTLYSVDIKHLGNGTANAHKAGDYGVVRNHIYNVILRSFGGFGSPVYVPEDGILEYPEDPTSTGEYVSAEVRILSWRLVSQEVDVQP
ncbi:MAG: Mfa1 fimbrilin C-terminal domain-containing protein [Alistipes sp.]|nr:Mfa1 fimbrilin C-terminal domain-containing protein [Alistipes sp.]